MNYASNTKKLRLLKKGQLQESDHTIEEVVSYRKVTVLLKKWSATGSDRIIEVVVSYRNVTVLLNYLSN